MAQRIERDAYPEDISVASLVDSTSIRVLHVDDDADVGALTATYLERVNPDLDVCTETSADVALERLADDTTTFDCVVSDYDMPGKNGIELLETVRERYPTLPFILYTGKGSEEVASDAISAGVSDYLQKGTGPDQYTVLANRIENAVEKNRAERNRDQLLGAIETAREGISLLNEDGRFVYVNQAYADTYDYDAEELLGEHWGMLYPDDDTARVTEEVIPNIPDEGTLYEETRMVKADGGEILADHALARTSDGLLVCTIRTLVGDHDENGLLVDVLDALDDLLFFFAEDGTLEFWNEEVETVTGYDADELSDRTPKDFVHEDDRQRMNGYVWAAGEARNPRVEVRLQQANGETVPYEFISKSVRNDRGEVVGRIGLGRDISERKQYEERFERQNERLEHFAEILSHDLRNPLAVADGYLQAFKQSGEEEHYETVQAALDRMDALITDVLDLAQTGTLIDEDEYERIALADVAESAWLMIRQDEASLEIEGSLHIDADASRLQQLLENLFRNAVEHGDPDVSVRVGILSDESGLYVEDDGPGIPEAAREEVFDAGHTTKPDGTGFGLATVKQLVEAHGWTIRITESADGGARFEVRGIEFVPE